MQPFFMNGFRRYLRVIRAIPAGLLRTPQALGKCSSDRAEWLDLSLFIAVGLLPEDYGDRRKYIPVGLVFGIHASDVPSIFREKPSSDCICKFKRKLNRTPQSLH